MTHKNETVFNSRWWSVKVPADWQVSEDTDCVTLSGKSSGAFQISAARKAKASITDDDLSEFAIQRLSNKALLRKVDTARFTGFCAEHIENGILWREWWLRAGNLMVYCSYNIEEKFKESENLLVDSILKSLTPLPV